MSRLNKLNCSQILVSVSSLCLLVTPLLYLRKYWFEMLECSLVLVSVAIPAGVVTSIAQGSQVQEGKC